MVDFRILGPFEVVHDGAALPLGGRRQRSLLAALVLHANEVLSTDRLIDAVWGATAPETARKVVQVYVSQLRRVLGDGVLVTRAPGYALQVAPEQIDLARFERLVGVARRSDPQAAAECLREGLALWRGPPLADLADESFAQAEVGRLEELRLIALEARIDADLALGGGVELVPELEALATEHPLRERLRAQLMLALYRTGRQAEALEAYRAARRLLDEELGLEPGEALQELERAVLRHDPSLDVTPAISPPPAAAERALLVAPRSADRLDALLALAEPLARSEPPRGLLLARLVDAGRLVEETAALSASRDELLARGAQARVAAFSSADPVRDLVRLATGQEVDLLLVDADPEPLAGDVAALLERAPCDVALVLGSRGEGPVLVPFGAAEHDWAALELGAWVARATGAPLRLLGAVGRREDGRDSSRLLADASLILQQTAGIVAEPVLADPAVEGFDRLAAGAGLLVIGLSERWREEGLGPIRSGLASAPPAPLVFVHRGPRPGGLAPAETLSRFSWSLGGGR